MNYRSVRDAPTAGRHSLRHKTFERVKFHIYIEYTLSLLFYHVPMSRRSQAAGLPDAVQWTDGDRTGYKQRDSGVNELHNVNRSTTVIFRYSQTAAIPRPPPHRWVASRFTRPAPMRPPQKPLNLREQAHLHRRRVCRAGRPPYVL
jgi:hypothetical protein